MADSHSSDDAFHEIQLNGKQLVFLFMAATVVSVVIFLCGVLVGRGVRATRGAVAQAASLSEVPAPDVARTVSPAPAVPASIPSGSDPTAAPPPPVLDDLSYTNRLEKTVTPGEDLKPAPKPEPATAAPKPRAETMAKAVPPTKLDAVPPPSSAAASKAATKPEEPPASTASTSATAASAAPAPPGGGYAVQVAAVNVRSEADSIAKRLSAKGYAAYVEAPRGGSGSVFRVRVGTFKTRLDADVVSAKLQAEEQVKPWVTR